MAFLSQQPGLAWSSLVPSAPLEPGVYWFSDEDGNILYVGKSKRLRARLRSYTATHRLHPKIAQMVHLAVRVQWKVLDSEFDALLVESKLIRLHQPKYNSLSKDDKTSPYIMFDGKGYVNPIIVRTKELEKLGIDPHNDRSLFTKGEIFGPFQSAREAGNILRVLRKIFPWCDIARRRLQQKNTVDEKKASCFHYHLGLCLGACIGIENEIAYRRRIHMMKRILLGKTSSVQREWKKNMHMLAKNKKFEEATQFRDLLYRVDQLKHTPLISDARVPILYKNEDKEGMLHIKLLLERDMCLPREIFFHRIECFDMSTLSGTNNVGAMVVFIDGEKSSDEYRLFRIRKPEKKGDVGMMREVFLRRQLHPEWGFPDLVIVDGGKPQLSEVLPIWEWTSPIIGIAKDPDRLVYKMPNGQWKEVLLQFDSMGKLMMKIRDETHRRAHGFHAQRRSKTMVE